MHCLHILGRTKGPVGSIQAAPFYMQQSFISTKERSQDTVSKNLIVINLHYTSGNSYNLSELTPAETRSSACKSWQHCSQQELCPQRNE